MTSSTTEDRPAARAAPDPAESDVSDAVAASSTFDRLRDYLAVQIGAVRRVEAGQQSAVALVEAADAELDELKRVLEAARLPAGR